MLPQRISKGHLSPKLLGHADIKLTLGTYSHFLPSVGDYAANAMESELSDRVAINGPRRFAEDMARVENNSCPPKFDKCGKDRGPNLGLSGFVDSSK